MCNQEVGILLDDAIVLFVNVFHFYTFKLCFPLFVIFVLFPFEVLYSLLFYFYFWCVFLHISPFLPDCYVFFECSLVHCTRVDIALTPYMHIHWERRTSGRTSVPLSVCTSLLFESFSNVFYFPSISFFFAFSFSHCWTKLGIFYFIARAQFWPPGAKIAHAGSAQRILIIVQINKKNTNELCRSTYERPPAHVNHCC